MTPRLFRHREWVVVEIEKSISAGLQHESRPASSPKYPEEVDVPACRCCCSHWTSSQKRVISEKFDLFSQTNQMSIYAVIYSQGKEKK